jgi:hypothetical protein
VWQHGIDVILAELGRRSELSEVMRATSGVPCCEKHALRVMLRQGRIPQVEAGLRRE